MKHFTIENDNNNITVYGSAKEADAVPDSERFSNEAALAKLAANWPSVRLVEIWNSLPGATEVKKFKDRATAVSRIWKAIQTLGAEAVSTAEAVAEAAPIADQPQAPIETDQPEAPTATDVAAQTPDVATEAAPAKVKAARAKKAPKTSTELDTPREGSKASQVTAMLKREGGTTLEEIMTAMGWLKHTTRAMLSAGGSLTKKYGLVIVSEKVGDSGCTASRAETSQPRPLQPPNSTPAAFLRLFVRTDLHRSLKRLSMVVQGKRYDNGRYQEAAGDKPARCSNREDRQGGSGPRNARREIATASISRIRQSGNWRLRSKRRTTPGWLPRGNKTRREEMSTGNRQAQTITENTDLGIGMLIAEVEDGIYQPVAAVVNISEGREIAASDIRRPMDRLQQGSDPMCPAP